MVSWPDLTFPPLNLWNFPKQPNLHKEHKMQISLTDANGSYNIFLEEDFDTLDQYVELLIKPILRAASFAEGSIDRYFINEDTMSDWTLDFELDDVEKKAACASPKEAVAKKAV